MWKHSSSHATHWRKKKKQEKEKKQLTHLTKLVQTLLLIIVFLISVEALRPKSDSEVSDQLSTLTRELEMLRSHASICPVNITFSNFEQHRKSNSMWYSSPFYTHPSVAIHANGDGKWRGKYISVFLHLMRGQFDDDLKWPFHGNISIQLPGYWEAVADGCDIVSTIYHFSFIADRVVVGKRSNEGWGGANFTSHASLRSTYLNNDRLNFLGSIV